MKYSKSAIGLLTREYRSVLKKCLLINLGLFALGAVAIATPAKATTNVATWNDFTSGLATENADLSLTADITGNNFVSSSKGATIHLDTYNLTINDVDGESAAFQITNSGMSVDGTGNLNFTNNDSTSGAFRIWSRNSKNSVITANVNSIVFNNNTGSAMAGAIFHENEGYNASDSSTFSTLTANTISFIDNEAKANNGAAILNTTGQLSVLGGTNTFTGNKRTKVESNVEKQYKRGGGAIANQSGTTADSLIVVGNEHSTNSFTGNSSAANGGAILNRSVDTDKNAYLTVNGTSTYSNNTATLNGGAIYNIARDNETTGHIAEVILSGSSTFTGNKADGLGGAIWNSGKTSIIGSALFEDNTANGKANDIYNTGILNLNATTGDDSIILKGGIDGDADHKGTTNVSGEGSVEVANALKNQTVNNTGTLKLNGADLSGTTINGDGKLEVAGDSAIENTTLTDQTMEVEAGKELSLNKVTLNKSADDKGGLNNLAGGTLNIKDSTINVKVNNAGILISDPTTYNDDITNSGTASFDADTINAGLNNTGVVSLLNGVTFGNGATITGTGTTNLVSGTTEFASTGTGTSNANTINVANGANWSGIINGGTINTQNGVIDAISGSVKNATVALDANLKGAGSIDAFGTGSNGQITSVNIIDSEYGTADSLTLALADGLTLADDAKITGNSYYTKVEQDGNTLKFSDKLVNTSTMNNTIRDRFELKSEEVYGDTTKAYSVAAADDKFATKTALNTTDGKFTKLATEKGAEAVAMVHGSQITDGTVAETALATATQTKINGAFQSIAFKNGNTTGTAISATSGAAVVDMATGDAAGQVKIGGVNVDVNGWAGKFDVDNIIVSSYDPALDEPAAADTNVYSALKANALFDTATQKLTGYTLPTTDGGKVAATDTVNAAFGKLQYQHDANATAIANALAGTTKFDGLKLAKNGTTTDETQTVTSIDAVSSEAANNAIMATKASVSRDIQAALSDDDQDIKANNITAHSATLNATSTTADTPAKALDVTATNSANNKTSKFAVTSDGITAEGKTTVKGGLVTDSLNFGGNNTVNKITASMINSDNKGANVLATAAAVYKAIGHVDGLITADAQGVRTFNGTEAEGLVSTNLAGEEGAQHYYGNLATGTDVARDLVSLDNAVGNLNFKASGATGEGEIATNYLDGVTTVSGALSALDTQAKINANNIGDVNFASAKIEALRDDTNLSEAIRTLDGYLNIDTGLWNNINALTNNNSETGETAKNIGTAIQYLGRRVDGINDHKKMTLATDSKTALIQDNEAVPENVATFYTKDGADAAFMAKNAKIDTDNLSSGVVTSLGKADTALQAADLADYAKTADVSSTYVAKANLADKSLVVDAASIKVDGKDVLTEHQSLADYAKTADVIATSALATYGTTVLDDTKNEVYTAKSIKGALDKAGTAIQGIAVQKGDAISVTVDDATRKATITYTDADTTYTQGNGVAISGSNVISVKLAATGSGLVADEAGLKVSGLTDDHIAANAGIAQSKIDGLTDALDAKQAALTEGNGIAISSTNAISVNYGDGLGVDNAGKLIVSGITDDNVSAISQSKITGLSDALAAKADTSLSNITDAGKTVINNQIASKVVSYTAGATTAPDADKIYSAASIQGSLDKANTALQAGDDATLGDVTADKLVLKGATGATDQELTAAKVASYDGYDSRITANTNRFDGFASDTQTVAQYVTANAKDATYDATHTIEQAIAAKADASSLNDYMLLADYTTGAAKDLNGAKLATESVAEGALEQNVQDKLAKAASAVQNGDASLTLGTGEGAEELTAAKIAQITTNAGLLAGMGEGKTVVSYVAENAVKGTYNPNGTYATDSIGAALQGKADANNVILRTAMVQTLPEKAHLVDADADRVASVTAIVNGLADKVNTDDVLDSVVASPADGKIYDAATVNSELAKKFNTGDIVTTVAASATASDTKVASEKAVRTELDKKVDNTTLAEYKVKDVDDVTIAKDANGVISVKKIGLTNIDDAAFGNIAENGTNLVRSGVIYTALQGKASLNSDVNFSGLTLGGGAIKATAISDGNEVSLTGTAATYATTLATELTVQNTAKAVDGKIGDLSNLGDHSKYDSSHVAATTVVQAINNLDRYITGTGENTIEDKDHYWTGDNVFKKDVTFQSNITVQGTVDATTVDTENLKIGDATVSSIDKGTTAVAVGTGDATKLATTATVLKSAQNAEFSAGTGETLPTSVGTAGTIHAAIVNVATAVDTLGDKVGTVTFKDADGNPTTNNIAATTTDLTSAVTQLDQAIGKVSSITADYAKTVTTTGSSNPADIATAIQNVATAAAAADGNLNFNQKFTTSDGADVADDGSNKAADLTTAINNVAKNAEAAIAGAVSDIAKEIHGSGTEDDPAGDVKLGDKAETIIVGNSYLDNTDPSAPETVILAGMGVDTVEREVAIAAVYGDSEVGADFEAKDEKVGISAANVDNKKTTAVELDNKAQTIALTAEDGVNHVSTGMTIDNANKKVTLGTNEGTGTDATSYTLEIDGNAKTTTIGSGDGKEVVIGEGDITADKSVTVGDMSDKGVKLDATDGSITTTGDANIGGDLAVASDATIAGKTTSESFANTNETFTVDSAGQVKARNFSNNTGTFSVSKGGSLTASEYHNGNNSFVVNTKGDVTAHSLTFNGTDKVNAIDVDGSNVSSTVAAATRKQTLATAETVYLGAENAKFTPAEGETGVTKEATTLHEAIAALDNAMGTMVLNTGNKNLVDDSGATLTNATDALNALDGVVGNVKDLNVSKGNLHATNKDVASHLSALDARLGTIKAIDGGEKGNLAVADSDVATHFGSLDVAMGNRTNYKNNSGPNGYVAQNDGSKDLTTMISEVASNIGKADDIRSTNQISAQQTVNANLSSLDAAIGNVGALSEELGATDLTSAINNLNTKVNESNGAFSKAINQLDMDQRKLRHDFEAGMAGQAALSALVPNAKASGNTQLAVGTGAYKGHTAAAVGGFHWFTDNLLFNAGVAWDNNEATGRMGITYSW